MLRNLKISTRLMAGISLILIVVLALIIPVSMVQITERIEEGEEHVLRGLYQAATAEIESEGRMARAMSHIISRMPELQAALANGDREELARRTVPLFKELKKDFAVRQFQFHLPPAVSFLRAHKPEKFGDDLSGFRKTILATNASLKPIQGLEKGVAGLGIRGLVPVFHDGKHVGSVEFGMSFDKAFFEHFKRKYGVDIALYVARDNGFQQFASTLGDTTMLPDAVLSRVMAGEVVTDVLETPAASYTVYAAAVKDFSGNPVGVLTIAHDRAENLAAISSTRTALLGIGLLALLAGLGVAFFVARGITRPINRTALAMDDIAQGEGDLTQRLEADGKDEVSMLAQSFNRFADKVHDIVKQVHGSTAQLAAAAEEMSSITTEMSQGVQRQQMETEQVATAMNEMTATVQEVARNATEASSSARDADRSAQNGKAVVDNTVNAIDVLAGEISTATDAINRLEEDTENIGTVLDVIRGIAEQTNLLALNAAIEAARAGEQGRGFAVVADEVRTLASRTQKSTEEINAMIARLQSGVQDAVTRMQSSTERSHESVDFANQARAALDDITTSVTMISDMNVQIASAAEEQSSVAEEINRNIVGISSEVQQTAEGARQTNTAGAELAKLANQLQMLVGQFKT